MGDRKWKFPPEEEEAEGPVADVGWGEGFFWGCGGWGWGRGWAGAAEEGGWTGAGADGAVGEMFKGGV